jgi:hypothetical protein
MLDEVKGLVDIMSPADPTPNDEEFASYPSAHRTHPACCVKLMMSLTSLF